MTSRTGTEETPVRWQQVVENEGERVCLVPMFRKNMHDFWNCPNVYAVDPTLDQVVYNR